MTTRHMTVCPVCDKDKWKLIYTIKSFNIEECTTCHFSRIDPLPERQTRSEEYNQEKIVDRNENKLVGKKAYNTFFWHFKHKVNRLSKRNKNKIFLDKFSKYLQPGDSILDIGCGGGSFLEHAVNKYKCSGIEISNYLADEARTKGIDVRVGDFQTMDYGDQKFKGISMISLIEHLDDPYGALKKCYDLLDDDGVLLLKTPNYKNWNLFFIRDKWCGFRPPDHITHFSAYNLRKLLQKIGFKKFKQSAQLFNDNMYCDAWK